MELTRLKANSQYRPCVDEKPYFSWVLTSEKKNVMQTSYHITVTGPEEVVWNSGIVESDKSIFVEYAGSPLKSLCEYRWTVTVTDNTGDSAVASSSFETGFMQKEWSAQWVRSPFPMKKAKKRNRRAERGRVFPQSIRGQRPRQMGACLCHLSRGLSAQYKRHPPR